MTHSALSAAVAIIVLLLFAAAGAMLLSGCAVVLAGCEYELKHTAKCEVGK